MNGSRGSSGARGRLVRPLVHLMPLFDAILRRSIGRVVVVRGRELLEDVLRAERRLVFAANHGPPHLPLVSAAAFVRLIVESGGGWLRTVGVTFRALYFVPALRRFMRYVTQLDSPPTFAQLLEGFRSDAWDAVVVMPEGAYCAFGDPAEVHPFASPRFVELATRIDSPIVLLVHRGLEGHAREVTLPRAMRESALLAHLPYGLGPLITGIGRMALPTSFARLPELRVAIDVHRPSVTSAELVAMPPAARREWIEREAEAVHAKMVALHRALGARP